MFQQFRYHSLTPHQSHSKKYINGVSSLNSRSQFNPLNLCHPIQTTCPRWIRTWATNLKLIKQCVDKPKIFSALSTILLSLMYVLLTRLHTCDVYLHLTPRFLLGDVWVVPKYLSCHINSTKIESIGSTQLRRTHVKDLWRPLDFMGSLRQI